MHFLHLFLESSSVLQGHLSIQGPFTALTCLLLLHPTVDFSLLTRLLLGFSLGLGFLHGKLLLLPERLVDHLHCGVAFREQSRVEPCLCVIKRLSG